MEAKELLLFVVVFVGKVFLTLTEEGPNVCVIEHVPDTEHRIFYDCKNWKLRTICGQKPILKYHCCDGYSHIPGTSGCIKVNPLKNILETARHLGARKFVKFIEQNGFIIQFAQIGAKTLFAPNDEAFKRFEAMKQHLFGNKKQIYNIINYHMVDGRLKSKSFEANSLVNTNLEGHKIRINKFSSWINTVNCVNIVNKDNEATNGIVHIINEVLDPHTAPQRNVADILLRDSRFTVFSRAIGNAGILKTLEKSKEQVTILAPTDAAFQMFEKTTLLNILNDDQAGEALIKSHILPHIICLPAIIGQHKLTDENKEKVLVECDSNGVKIGGNHTSLKEFISADNGIIYVTDSILIPDRAKDLTQLMEDEHLDTFLKIMRFAGVDVTFEDAGEYTLFVPSEKGFLSMSENSLNELYRNISKAKQFVLHHAIRLKLTLENFADNNIVTSLDEKYPIQFHVNRKSIGVGGSLIEKQLKQGRNGKIFIISKPLMIIEDDWEKALNGNKSYSIFISSIKKTELRNHLQVINTYQTIFVPTNDAFLQLGQRYLDHLMTNITFLRNVLQNHLLYKFITKDSLENGLYYNFPTASGKNIYIQRDEETMIVNNSQVINHDILYKNGIIHIINDVILDLNTVL